MERHSKTNWHKRSHWKIMIITVMQVVPHMLGEQLGPKAANDLFEKVIGDVPVKL